MLTRTTFAELRWKSESFRYVQHQHGYRIFSMLCTHNILEHGCEEQLNLLPSGEIGIRGNIDRLRTIAETIVLSGLSGRKNLMLSEIKPSSSVYSRLCTIKSFTEPVSFKGSVERQLNGLMVKGVVQVRHRGVIWIHSRAIVGFAVKITALSDEDSIVIQAAGIGGRKRYGCGVFNPWFQ